MTTHIYDIIGDVHGMYDPLCSLLEKLETSLKQESADAEYRLIFLGDIIDRGEKQKETFTLVRELVEQKKALCLLGNHEYNAIMRALHLRTKHDAVHEVFLKSFSNPETYQEAIAFMKTLPFFVELPLFNCVHACFNEPQLSLIKPYLDKNNVALNDEIFVKSSKPKLNKGGIKALYDAVEIILKGPEIDLPDGIYYLDKDGTKRDSARTRWWQEKAATYRDIVMWKDEELLQKLKKPLPLDFHATPLLKPVFFGHYWLWPEGTKVSLKDCELAKDKAYCLDFSAVMGGTLTAMRVCTDDEKILKKEVFAVKTNGD